MKWAKTLLVILLASASMLLPAFFNGFPLLYSDTGAYIASGFEGKVPLDRPITYGLFLRHASLAHSLWFVVLAQSIIVSALLWVVFTHFLGSGKRAAIWFLALVFGLNLLSSLPWISGMLMADIFTPISFLLLYILMFQTPTKKWLLVFFALAYLFTTATHLTHAPAHLALLVGIAFFKLIIPKFLQAISWLKWSLGFALVLLNFVFLPALHYTHDAGWVSSRSGHLFLTARFVESGAVKAYLDENCADKTAFLCQYKDSLPNNGSDFLWLPESILYKTGGWAENTDGYKEINRQILRSPAYFNIYFFHTLKVLQFHLFAHNIGEELIPLGLNSPPGWETEAHFKNELPQLLGSKQTANYWQGKLNGLNQILFIVWAIAILICFYFLFSKQLANPIRIFILCIFLVYLGNFIAVCIASSGSRYNARLDWLFVFMAALSFSAFLRKNPESRVQNPESRLLEAR
ncbi:MAG: hypothetical protein ACOVK9_03320 [Bacteroidia bacterium]